MSFSSNVKEELSRNETSARHCKIAEIAGFLQFCGEISEHDGHRRIQIHTETVSVAKRFYTLLKDVFQIQANLQVSRNDFLKRSRNYTVSVDNPGDCDLLLKAVKLTEEKEFGLVLQNTCCKRAYLRGAFQAAGSMSDPEKNYHFEIVSMKEDIAQQLKEVLNFFELDAKIVLRKKYYVVYIKEGAKIVDALNIIEAHIALMEFENIRILKDMRNTVNRRVNCETANINKTVSAAVKQVEDIEYIMQKKGLHHLNQGLQDIAHLRLENPEATLKELGDMLEPPVGKSGVNHRLKKISKMAEEMRLGGKDDF
jgi:DNA-binding protein WhiA